jgi:putative oxidoreductase
MSIAAKLQPLYQLDRYFDALQSPFALVARVYVSWVFLKSCWLKLQDWEQTVSLFESEYKVPLLSPALAAIAGTAGELVFPVLLILGLGGRIAPLGLFAVNAVAVVSYWHIFSSDIGIVGLRQHQLWGFILAMLTIYGVGHWSMDRLIRR